MTIPAPVHLESIAARVQGLPASSQVLLMAGLHETHRQGSRFSPAEIVETMDLLALPRVHVSNALAALSRSGSVGRIPGRGAVWRITPQGKHSIDLIVAPPEALLLAHAISETSGSVLGGRIHSLVPHWLAPPELSASVRQFVEDHPFERNVFAMTRFPRAGTDQDLRATIDAAAQGARDCGYQLLVASERSLADDLWGNVMAHIWASARGVAIFEDRAHLGLNYNLTIETGAMLMSGRRCLLLRDASVTAMPSDFVGHIYHSVRLDDPQTVRAAVAGWLVGR